MRYTDTPILDSLYKSLKRNTKKEWGYGEIVYEAGENWGGRAGRVIKVMRAGKMNGATHYKIKELIDNGDGFGAAWYSGGYVKAECGRKAVYKFLTEL